MTMSKSPRPAGALLSEHQRLPTSGARGVLVFEADRELRLAIPQLAADIPGAPAYMNGGDSDIDMLLFRWSGGVFIEDGRLPVPGGEDAVYFQFDGRQFLATASVRTGSGPYELNADSVLYERVDSRWEVFQKFPTFAAKQWHYFAFHNRRFLALAQGVTIEGAVAKNPRHSCIFEWNGDKFDILQTLDGRWGYNWSDFEIDGRHFLGYADHSSPSGLRIWDGKSFAPFQEFAPQGGRAFEFFRADGQAWLAFANLTGESFLYRWRAGRFEEHQSLGGPGAREFAVARTNQALYLVKINFIHGTPTAPKTDLMSCLYEWKQEGLVLVEEFPTSGGTDAAVFSGDGQIYLAVSNSLSRDIRFREDTVIYQLNVPGDLR